MLVLFGVLDDVPAATGGRVPTRPRRAARAPRRDARQPPGQIAFPGGRLDETDADATAALRLREAVEETGVDPGGVRTLGAPPESRWR